MKRLISIDPGKTKCGLLLADLEKKIVLDGKVVYEKSVLTLITQWIELSPVQGIILGNGTTSQAWKNSLNGLAPIEIVEEWGTTLRARSRYWELWPPNWLLRLIPRGLLLPPANMDALAALVLIEDYLDYQLTWPVKPEFKIWHEQ